MFSALSWILGFYSNFAIAWVVVVATDISFNKGLLKLAPAQPEYRRGMIYNVNPVGVVSFGLAAGLSICAFFGLLGATLAPFSPLIALVVAFVMTPLMGLLPAGATILSRWMTASPSRAMTRRGTPPPPCINALAVRKSTSART